MNLLHITDLKNGHVQVAWQRGNAIPRSYAHPIAFADSLTTEDRKDLRWYLEQYLQFPYGAERQRAQQVENKMARWGESLFKQVFAKGDEDPDPRAFYQEAVREGLEQCEICISSEDPAFLNTPWELLRDPTPGRGYLAPSLAGLFRQRSGHKIEAPLDQPLGEPFRILLVIARPHGERDIPLGTVARPVLEAVRPLRPRLQLEVLRPPTFDALVKRLNEQRGFYHLVHFDGHGVFAGVGGGSLLQYGAMAGRGHVVFETEDGQPHVVNSQDLGQALATCKVPLFVLNACQSAEESLQDPFSSVAAQLVAVGAKGVVAMSYSVYATAAALFMERFYEQLVEHASLSEAVAAARQRLFTDARRQSVIGPLELRDWLVPTLYQQEVSYIPIPPHVGVAAAEEEPPEGVLRQRAEQVCPEGRFGFVGRDYDILRVERALRQDRTPWVLLTGLGGTGKTELAFGFARWYAETGGCPGGVFATSFKQKADFGQVVGSIMGYGTDFSLLPEEQQWQDLVGYLREHPCLLVWDNFETVAGYPQGADPLAPGEERDKLARFLQALRGGRSRVIVTTRKPDESWLGVAYELVEVRGLTNRDAAQLAERILRTVGRRPQDYRDDPDYARLIRLLRGHPRSLEVVLPGLRRRSPADVIHALQHRIDSLGDVLDASLAYGFTELTERTRRHLPFVGLFASYVHAGMIATFISAGDEQQAVYQEVMGEALDAAGWEMVLEEAASAGLIRPLGSRVYELHPTLPPFLRRHLESAVGEGGLKRLNAEFARFYAALADDLLEGARSGERDAIKVVDIEEVNLLRALQLAGVSETWEEVQAIAQTLGEFYAVRGRTDEWNVLRRRLLRRVGREMPAGAGRERADLWMYLLGDEANDALGRNDLAAAEAAYRRIFDYLLSLNDPVVEPKVAMIYHQLGRITEEQQQFDQAEAWYRQAMEIFERLGLERYAASDYHQLGIIAQERQQFDQAEAWYRQALEIFERLGLERDAASDYHQLGTIAQERQQFNQAEAWYRQALEITERLGLERDAADGYHQLGMIAQERQQFDQAEAWYRQALEIRERLGLERYAAAAYHQLGRIAQERQQFDQAEAWYRQALEIFERLGHPPLQVNTLAQLGVLRSLQGRLDQAVVWFGRASAIATAHDMRVGIQILAHLARVMKAMGEEQFTAAWRQAFEGQEPPLDVLRELLERT